MKMVLTTATLLSTSQHRFLGNRSTPTRVAETLTSIGKAEKCITRSIDRATNRRGKIETKATTSRSLHIAPAKKRPSDGPLSLREGRNDSSHLHF